MPPGKLPVNHQLLFWSMESYVLLDRQRLSEGGIVIILAQVSASNGQMIDNPDIIIRGFTLPEGKRVDAKIVNDIKGALNKNKRRVTNWQYIKKVVGDVTEKRIFKDLHHRPLVLPVVIEV